MEKLSIPRTAIRLNVALQGLAMLVLLFAVNYFSFHHYARADFSRSQKFVLSEQTKRVLRELKKPVRITVFFSPTVRSPETALFPDVQNLLKELIFSGRKKIEVEYVDPTRNLSRARELQDQYRFSASENVVILDYDGRSKFVPISEMADFDMGGVESGEAPRLLAFKGEQALTNGMIALISPERLKVYFLQGHGEPGIEKTTPLSVFKDYVERQNVSAAPLSLASLDAVPADCAALVIVSPQLDIEQREAMILEKYWKEKGRLLILLDPRAKTPRLADLLKQTGVIPLDNRVLRIVRLPFATGILREVTAEFLPKNAITKRMAGITILFPAATQSLAINAAQAQSAGVQIWPLIRASDEFWGESEYVTDEKKGVRYDEGKDAGQPVYLALAAARGGVKDERVEVESAKLIVVGSSEFALDAALNQQGLDFLLSSMNWLFDRGQLTGVMPKSVKHFSLNLTDAQLGSIALYTMVLMPGIAALATLVVWWRRRV
jgi:gliding motility-associatede transport system auxiliary component